MVSQRCTCGSHSQVVSGPGKGQPHQKDVQAEEGVPAFRNWGFQGPRRARADLELVESAKPGSLSFQHQDFPKSFPDVVGLSQTTLEAQ